MNILIIDDDELVAGYFSRTVRMERPRAITYVAIDDLSAEIYLQAHEFDLIFCDIHMAHGKSGPDILRACKDRLAKAKVVMLSCHDQCADICFQLRNEGLPIVSWQHKPVYSQDLKRLLQGTGL
jgi:DNA-binding NarL/FixJ family response regulator